MEIIAQFGNTFALLAVGVLVWFYLRGRFDQADRRTNELRDDMNRRFDEMRHDIDRRFEQNDRQHDRFAADIAAIRSDLTQIALTLGVRNRPESNPA